MLNCYAIQDASLYTVSDQELKDGAFEPIWIDVTNPTPDEEKAIASIFNIRILSDNTVKTLKLPSCHYQQKQDILVTINILHGEYKTQPVNIVLTPNRIITTQRAGTPETKDYINHVLQNNPDIITPNSIFAYLIESRVNDISSNCEQISSYLDSLSETIFSANESNKKIKLALDVTVNQLGKKGHIISKHRASLISIRRALIFIRNSEYIKSSSSEKEKFDDLISEISLLEESLSSLSNEKDFLLELTFAMIDAEQSSISKLLSIVALIFLPPSITTGAFATGFDSIPLVHWEYGFWFSVALIIVSGGIPYLFCKIKRWV